jgi:chemotaxis protein methyltransferase CheR
MAPRRRPTTDPGLRMSDGAFRLFRTLIEAEVGIQIPEAKRPLLVSRLARRLRDLGLDDFEAYYRRVTTDRDEAERARMFDLISTNETRFFREPKQFEFLERHVLPAWTEQAAQGRRPRSVRVWSAACSTGEEPYSIGMLLLSGLPGWEIEILGTDLSTRVLDRARAALWPIEKSQQISEPCLKAYMLRGTGEHEGCMKAGPELRRLVRFQRLNLHDARCEVDGRFDLIFCRNVLIYFSVEGRASVVRRLVERLAPGGYLFLGAAETLAGASEGLRSVGPAAYSLAERAAVPRRRQTLRSVLSNREEGTREAGGPRCS